MTEVIIKSGYTNVFPDILDELNEGLDWSERADKALIQRVKDSTIVIEEEISSSELYDLLSANRKSAVYFKKSERYFGWSSRFKGNITSFSIVEVDISRRWTISDYDNNEYIEYIDVYECCDKALNFYIRKSEE